ncbi:MAG: dipeptide/oligopeptide/nickel ABC transporter ATP-binding protein [Planctomycetes bacterium]|nr:dipeptide/oligopeptide/nickel ABC transporter ATP-binding protein [Planctomycetota bacterium]MCC8116261.1 dipeptide/oligopeptide/nickel ABC transporter ATP-binding protein [Planctomycetota bacterium]
MTKSTGATAPLLEVRSVRKHYRRGSLFGRRDGVDAVGGVSFRLEAGRCLALAGPSGSGKSTLARLVLGLETPDSGEVLFRGQPVAARTGPYARRAVQAVFQNSLGAVNPRFSAKDIIAEPLRNFFHLRGPALTERVGDLMAEVGLDPAMMNKYPHQWSGGELQRLCIARALAPGPDLLVLDEAVSSLDMLNQARIIELLTRLRRDRKTAYLFITHDMRVVAAVADSLAVMDQGKICYYADDLDAVAAADAFDHSGVCRDLLLAVPPADGR